VKRSQLVLIFAIAILASASTWFYMNRILKPQQVAYATAHHQPRGNLSDLYPRWLGARELLLRGRSPYSAEITIEIQQGYYGRALDPSRPDDPKDQQAFAYPGYVIFLLAPTVKLPFGEVEIVFRWLLIALTAVSVIFWLRLLHWKGALFTCMSCVVLVLGSIPAVQGIKLQQLSLLVTALLAGCAVCLTGGWFLCAGGLLALATIKPQLAWPLVVWLLLWAVSEWRTRWKFIFSFGLAMILLFGGAEIVLPGWWRMFLHALSQYHQYTNNRSLLEWPLGPAIGGACEALAVLSCGFSVWPARNQPASNEEFGRAFALVLALTVLIVPMISPYNQVLLAPAVLMLVRDAKLSGEASPAIRFIRWTSALILIWPWIATIILSSAHFFLSPDRVQSLWRLPFYSTLPLPIFVFGLALLEAWNRKNRGLRADTATA